MSAATCTTFGHSDRIAVAEVLIVGMGVEGWNPYCGECAGTLQGRGHDVQPIYGTASFRSDDGPGYPNWTLTRMGDIFREAGKMMARYNAAPENEPPDMDFYRHQMRVLYDLLHEDGR